MNSSLFTSDRPLKVKIGKIEQNIARLSFSDRQSFEINVKFLPRDARVGDVLYLNLLSESEFEMTRKEVAQAVLDDILN